MRNYQEHDSTESRIQQGVAGIKTGQYTSIRKAAEALGIKPSTLAIVAKDVNHVKLPINISKI